jgi:hypothetical protein
LKRKLLHQRVFTKHIYIKSLIEFLEYKRWNNSVSIKLRLPLKLNNHKPFQYFQLSQAQATLSDLWQFGSAKFSKKRGL